MKYSNLSNASQELLEGRIELSFNVFGLGDGGVSRHKYSTHN